MAALKRPVLGRGLDALIALDDLKTSGSSSINEIELSKIQPNPEQPRSVFEQEALEELAMSIRSMGVIQPITLKEINENQYLIISGERRYRAALMVGLERIPAYIKTAADEHIMEMALIENIQREDLNSIEIALAYQKLMENYGMTQEQLSERVGKKRTTIANYLRLLKLPAEIQMGLKDKKIDMGHARALVFLWTTLKCSWHSMSRLWNRDYQYALSRRWYVRSLRRKSSVVRKSQQRLPRNHLVNQHFPRNLRFSENIYAAIFTPMCSSPAMRRAKDVSLFPLILR